VHYAIPHASAAVNAKQILATYGIHIPIVTTLHGTDITLLGKDKSFKPVIEYAINQSDAVTAVSQNLKEETLLNFKIKDEIKVIPNFIDMSLYKQEYNQVLRDKFAEKEEAILVHISNFRKVKRVQDVVKIFEKVNKQVSSKLFMIGDGPERLKSEQLCRKLGIAKHVRFLGKLKVIEKFLCIADVFVLPSKTESFGLVALEAMASKVAVISTNSGGLPEVNIDGETGYLSDVGDVNKMADDTIHLLKDANKLNQFKNNALAHAKTFDLPNILPQYEAVYQELSLEMNK
jgi:N-acetyl-alpha-D-glucosaminyl L-malate synthase BshA